MTLNSDPTVTISLDLFTVSLLLASLLFSFCLVLAKRKYVFLRRVSGPELDTKKLLILSAATACFLRIMSFVGVIAMDIANVRAHYSLKPVSSHPEEGRATNPTDKNQSFYDSAMTVLFDLPNAIVISTYVLLTLVWAESALMSRMHTESSVRWRKKWLVWYTIFNSGLYATQIILYFLIFAGGDSVAVVRNIVNVAMSGLNLSAVFLVFLLYLYLNVSFSGYPFRSQNAQESLRKISNVMLFWSLTRIVWGISMLVIYIRDVDLLRPSEGGWAPIFFLLLLILCEIAPVIILMDYSFVTVFEFDSAATRAMPSLQHSSSRLEIDQVVGDEASMSTAREPLLSELS
ncbi:hypothetical protein HJC23_000720 [Cyclotella cryptica]|uniref:THH1/TOM1/TOM3 domain-containing protein n=1 Tax=Cyclotella cryptica TaxID=29204 RepID=A0ABD3QA89_9STRA|eukprot:CCRYP_007411-RB/>CCRYP_007411-RB protein AED:0.04 eAED:0.04 QI:180/1/1/1/0.33/0.28/7/2920/345